MEQGYKLLAHDDVKLPIPTTSALGLTRTYAGEWEPSDAFRELYQNWKDAIIQSHNLKLTDFHPQLSETELGTTITIRRRNTPSSSDEEGILGYIQFQKNSGTVEFTNFDAVINPNSLELGYTTKTDDARLAGRYGDGLKIAALVLCRNDYHVRIWSNCCYWNFGFKGKSKNEFYYQLKRAGDSRVSKAKMKFNNDHQNGKPRKMSPNIWEDVSVSVGRIREQGRPVTAETFQDWMKIILDVHRPSSVCTPCGNLILDQAYAGHLYVKGIRVSFADSPDSQYRFGYNFLSPVLNPNRDRRLDAHPERLAMAVAAIWEAAIRQEATVLSHYTNLLKNHPTSADVAFAHVHVTETTAQMVWASLVADARIKGHFYFPGGFEADNVDLIQNELKYEPTALPNSLWRLLRRYSLVRLPFEEIYHRFQQSQEVEPPGTLFARETSRAFAALLSALPMSKDTRVVYVQCNDYRPNMAFSKDRDILYVHHRWLDFRSAHNISPCEASEIGEGYSEEYFCHHIVEDMYKRAVLAIRRLIDNPQISVKDVESLQNIFRQGRDKIREMPTMIQIAQGKTAGSLKVTWNDSYSRKFSQMFGMQIQYIAVLHSVACIPEAQRLWYREGSIHCECPRQIVHQTANFALFEDLDDQPRFSMVARYRESAIWGLPTHPLSPNDRLVESPLPLQSEGSDVISTDSESSDPYSPSFLEPECYGAPRDRINTREAVLMTSIFDSHCRRMAAWGSRGENEILTMLKAMQVDESALSAHDFQLVTHSQPDTSTIESGQYLQVLSTYTTGPIFILYVHDTFSENGTTQLLVTKYSLLSKHPSLADRDICERELLLHFTDFDHMGEREDAELIQDDISNLHPINTRVEHVFEEPAASLGYFCRYATRRTSKLEDCFWCPVKTPTNYEIPQFLALPAPSVIDLSIKDPGISAGFLAAGCRVDIGVNAHIDDLWVHDLWKKQNPNADVVDTVGEGLNDSARLFDFLGHRVAAISGGMRILSCMPEEWDADKDDRAVALDNCRFVATHESRPEFILLTLHWAGWSQLLSNTLTHTILVLLQQRYSVHTCLHTISSGTGKHRLLFILAAPFCTNPQWLDDTLNDINQQRIPLGQKVSIHHDPHAVAIRKGFSEEVGGSINPLNYHQILEGVPPLFSQQIATAICNICGRIQLLGNRSQI